MPLTNAARANDACNFIITLYTQAWPLLNLYATIAVVSLLRSMKADTSSHQSLASRYPTPCSVSRNFGCAGSASTFLRKPAMKTRRC